MGARRGKFSGDGSVNAIPGHSIPLGMLGVMIDRERYLVTFAGESVQLTYMEFHVLLRIAGGGGRVVSYDELALAFWGASSALTRRRLAVLVSRIRAKLGAGARCIDTVKRVGYRLTAAAA